ncbi:Vacuolar protein sorting-associated protein 62 [Cladochytrium tenue]|nr:Vacuolar protein sorting-associated protein 62 [Cladochytrium tenue]
MPRHPPAATGAAVALVAVLVGAAAIARAFPAPFAVPLTPRNLTPRDPAAASAANAAALMHLDRRADYTALANTYAPLVKYHPDETFFCSSVEYMFPYYSMIYSNGSAVSGAPSSFSDTNLDFLYQEGVDAGNVYLSVPGQPTAEPTLSSDYSYLYSTEAIGVSAPIYAFVSPKANGVVDIYYWVFAPYNLGKDVVIFGYVGDHVGDWERIMVRTVNGVAVSIDYLAHSSGLGLGTLSVSDSRISWSGTHPVAYTALGSHGMWPQSGSNVYDTIALVYNLVDETGDGAEWSTWDNLYLINYQQAGGYTGAQAWLNYDGYFGNPGDTSCWFYSVVSDCAFGGGPSHPNRDMTGTTTNVLATVNSDTSHSSYTFYLSADAQTWAHANGITYVAVHQHCGSWESIANQDKWGFVALASGTGATAYTVSTASCDSSIFSRYVDTYAVGLCTSDSSDACTTTSGTRSIIQYSGSGVVQTRYVVVNDLDLWSWSY